MPCLGGLVDEHDTCLAEGAELGKGQQDNDDGLCVVDAVTDHRRGALCAERLDRRGFIRWQQLPRTRFSRALRRVRTCGRADSAGERTAVNVRLRRRAPSPDHGDTGAARQDVGGGHVTFGRVVVTSCVYGGPERGLIGRAAGHPKPGQASCAGVSSPRGDRGEVLRA